MTTTNRDYSWNGGKVANKSLRHYQRGVVYSVVRDYPHHTADQLHPLVNERTKDRGVTRIKAGRMLRLLEDLEDRGEIRYAHRGRWRQWSTIPREDRP